MGDDREEEWQQAVERSYCGIVLQQIMSNGAYIVTREAGAGKEGGGGGPRAKGDRPTRQTNAAAACLPGGSLPDVRYGAKLVPVSDVMCPRY